MCLISFVVLIEAFVFRVAAGLLLYYGELLKKMDFIYAAQLLTRLPESLPGEDLFAVVETVPAHVPSWLGPGATTTASTPSSMASRASPSSGFQMIGSSAPPAPAGQKSFSQLVLEVRAQLEPIYRADATSASSAPSNSLLPTTARAAASAFHARTSSNASSLDSHPTLHSSSSCGSLTPDSVSTPATQTAAGEQQNSERERDAVQV